MAKVAYKIIKVTFGELQQLFITHCEKLGLFTHSQAFGYTADEAFDTYLYCWKRKMIRDKDINPHTFTHWKKRGWIDEERRNEFMEYCFGNRWKSAYIKT